MTDQKESCATCQYSDYYEKDKMFCMKNSNLSDSFPIKKRTDKCDDYEREPGTEGDK